MQHGKCDDRVISCMPNVPVERQKAKKQIGLRHFSGLGDSFWSLAPLKAQKTHPVYSVVGCEWPTSFSLS